MVLRHSLKPWWTAALIMVTGLLSACSDSGSDSGRQSPATRFQADESAFVAQLVEAHPGLDVQPTSNPIDVSSDDTDPSTAKGGVAVRINEEAARSSGDLREALAELSRLRPVVQLRLDSVDLKNANVGFLADMEHVEVLTLSDVGLTGSALEAISQLPAVRVVEVFDSDVTVEAAAALARIKSLTGISFAGSELSGDTLANFKGHESLQSIEASGSTLDDEACQHLADIPQLHSIIANDTQITDEGLKHLSEMRQLRYLNVMSTKVTPRGILTLKKTLPNLTVFY